MIRLLSLMWMPVSRGRIQITLSCMRLELRSLLPFTWGYLGDMSKVQAGCHPDNIKVIAQHLLLHYYL